MPDIYLTRHERIVRRERDDFWNEWENEADTLGRIQREAMALLTTLDDLRSDTYRAAAVAEIDHFAADFAGTLHDLISNRIGAAQKRGDAKGIGVEWIDCETSVFTEEVDRWLERSDARRPVLVEMTEADLGLPA